MHIPWADLGGGGRTPYNSKILKKAPKNKRPTFDTRCKYTTTKYVPYLYVCKILHFGMFYNHLLNKIRFKTA